MLGKSCAAQSRFIEDEEVVTPEDYRAFAEAGDTDEDYEWQRLWQIPVYLRSRKQYYQEALERIRQRIEKAWARWRERGASREQFEQSSTARGIWSWGMPAWWGLHDVVGWIDIQLDIRGWQVHVALFLPAKRISRQLKDKTFVPERRLTLPLGEEAVNKELRDRVIEAVDVLAAEPRLKKLYIDLDQWRLLVAHTDLVGLLHDLSVIEAVKDAELVAAELEELGEL